ncbi:energy-coupling factor ABC transporter ATP-binding protein [Methanoculleus sp. FWC-SCC1]|uniref:Energy-coupling factor ABC transporter ATP-binding protein n=1 Tax=Methanoculleus frigidifontis TaxID=2584085 RepID=A0ABT8M8Z3_9EURY|nr:energy-coupling factor ABC transporter ATP-binding protein [Methanoculleus sp. FWC-SCC1]MDN7024402.1 energy-coupling factor ABC transporter ATP-binding protein [Methanoculleus sp. FWC-SCC1]
MRILLNQVHHRLLDIPVLRTDARIVAVIGPNGSGKTTLLELLAGMEEPEAGEVTLADRLPAKMRVGWVGEFPDRTMLFSRVHDEIASPLRFGHAPCRDIDAKVHEIAALLGIAHLLPKATETLSGGEKVLVAFAAALAPGPEILILDEVDTHLDEAAADRVTRALRSRPETTVVLCTQNMDAAAEADHLLYLEGGRVLLSGTPKEVFAELKATCFYPTLWRMEGC